MQFYNLKQKNLRISSHALGSLKITSSIWILNLIESRGFYYSLLLTWFQQLFKSYSEFQKRGCKTSILYFIQDTNFEFPLNIFWILGVTKNYKTQEESTLASSSHIIDKCKVFWVWLMWFIYSHKFPLIEYVPSFPVSLGKVYFLPISNVRQAPRS